MKSLKMLIIADDYTGAMDTGVQFTKRGIKSLVTTWDRIFDVNMVGSQVLVVDTQSRHIDKKEALKRVRIVTETFKDTKRLIFFKKTDSTLRGNVGSEIAGMMKGSKRAQAIFVPAYPKAGRTTEKGIQYVNNTPLHETEFAKDPFNPIITSNVGEIVAKGFDGSIKISNKVNRLGKKAIQIIDCLSLKQMDSIVQDIESLIFDYVLAGCAGLAEGLSELSYFNRSEVKLDYIREMPLVICGSVNDIALKQMEHAQKNIGYKRWILSPKQKIQSGYWQSDEGKTFIQKIISGQSKGEKNIIQMIKSKDDFPIADDFYSQNNDTKLSMPDLIAKNTGMFINEILKAGFKGNLMIIGGDTLMGFIKKTGCIALEPGIELLPGVVYSQVSLPLGNINLITKAGGFGEVDVMVQLKERLSEGILC